MLISKTTLSTDWNIGNLTNESLEDYQCYICFLYPQNKEFYQCIEGHIACRICWERNLEIKKECMFCKCKVEGINELSRARFIEKQFQKKIICCPFLYINFFGEDNDSTISSNSSDHLVKDLENGCNETIKIENLDSHILNCSHRFVECDNRVNGCNEIIRFNQLDQHDRECLFKLVECKSCSNFILRKVESQHYIEDCPEVLVGCINCPKLVKRFLLDEHLERDCENTLISCKFSKFGCNEVLKRIELENHLETINHSVSFEKYLDSLNEQLSSLVKSNQKLSNKVESLTNKVNKNIKTKSKRQKYINRWTITNISKLLGDFLIGECIESPSFQIGPFKFNFTFYPYRIDDEHDDGASNGNRSSGSYNQEIYQNQDEEYDDDDDDDDCASIDDRYYCSIFLNNLTNSKIFKFKYSITLENKNPKDSLTLKCNNEFNKDLQSYGFVQTLLSSDLSDGKNGWISNDSITFSFKITIIYTPKELIS